MRCARRLGIGLGILALFVVPALAGSDYAGQDLSERSFKDKEILGSRFDGANLTKADLTGAKARGSTFVDADLSRATLDGADLREADFRDAKFEATMARGTDFGGAKLRGANLSGYSSFRGSRFVGADLREIKGPADITECDFSGADLRGASFKDARDWSSSGPSTKWSGARFDEKTKWPKGFDPEASGVVRAGPDEPGDAPKTPVAAPGPYVPPKPVATGQKAVEADWRARDLHGESFDDIDLSRAILTGVNFDGASLRHASLHGADLWSARFRGADLTGCDLRGANLKGVMFWDTKLDGANLEGQDLSILWGLTSTSLKAANLADLKGGLHNTVSGCDFRRADLRGAHLAGPGAGYVASCDFRGALYDGRTRWPKGFDPEAAGAVRIGAAEGDPGLDDGDPPRLMAPDRDPNAPSEAIVKKTFREYLPALWGAFLAGHDTGERSESLVSRGVRFEVAWKKLTYMPAQQIRADRRAGEWVTAFPLRIECDLTSVGADGSERTDPADWVVHFYRTEDGIWKAIYETAKSAAPGEDR